MIARMQKSKIVEQLAALHKRLDSRSSQSTKQKIAEQADQRIGLELVRSGTVITKFLLHE